ncbi:hypothetical protein [Paenibacillus fonticola]|nr:hypothetical protein [Paenibacillus fonticola]
MQRRARDVSLQDGAGRIQTTLFSGNTKLDDCGRNSFFAGREC